MADYSSDGTLSDGFGACPDFRDFDCEGDASPPLVTDRHTLLEQRELDLAAASRGILDIEIARSVRTATHKPLKFPWEHSEPCLPDPYSAGVHKLFIPLLPRLPTGDPANVPAQTMLKTDHGKLLSSAVKHLHVIPWPIQQTNVREKALHRWRLVIEENFQASDVGRRMHEDVLRLHDDKLIASNIADIFASKSPSTLNKRSGPILRFLIWHRKNYGTSGIPFKESRAYEFIKSGTFSPTFAKSFMSALRFCKFFLGFESASEVIDAKRVLGASHIQGMNKRVLRQRRPLTLLEILALESLARSASCPYDRYAACFFLVQPYSRARYGDYSKSHKLIPDFTDQGTGYLEAPTLFAKTQRSTEAKRTLMPQVAPQTGASDFAWANVFVAERKKQGIENYTALLPTPSVTGGWHDVPTDVATASIWLRNLLKAMSFDVTDVGTHSLKRTLLSWCAKFGIDINVRALLGYHISTEHSSALVYSRDAMAHPLRCLDAMLLAVREKRFLPDSTRSGHFAKQKEAAPAETVFPEFDGLRVDGFDASFERPLRDGYEIVNAEACHDHQPNPDLVVSQSSSSESSSVSNDSSSDSSALDGKLDADAQIVLAKRKQPLPSDTDGKVPYYHPTSAVLHYRLSEAARLKCGRVLSTVFVKTTWAKAVGLINCSVCFK